MESPTGYDKEQFIVPPEGGVSYIGWDIAISDDGNTLAMGAPYHDNTRVGAVFIYTRSGNTWSEEDVIISGDILGSVPRFGSALAISEDGNTLVVGSEFDDSIDLHNWGAGDFWGSVWIYVRSSGVWTLQQKIRNTGAVTASLFGASVDITADGNKIIVGDPGDRGPEPAHPGFGQVLVYERISSSWSLVSTLSPSDEGLIPPASFGSFFGETVKFMNSEGTRAVIGGPDDDIFTTASVSTGQGAVWTFEDSGGGSWNQVGTKLFYGSEITRQFGHEVAACPTRLAVTSWRFFNSSVGHAVLDKMLFIYGWDEDTQTWTLELDTDIGLGTAEPDSFYTVELNEAGTLLLVGTADGAEFGPIKSYVVMFLRDEDGNWTQSGDAILPNEVVVQDAMGFSVDMTRDGKRIVFGIPDYSSHAGASFVYRFRLSVNFDGFFVPLGGT